MNTFQFVINGHKENFKYPSYCPVCHAFCIINSHQAIAEVRNSLELVTQCTNPSCHRLFISVFKFYPSYGYCIYEQFPQILKTKEYSENIIELSSTFVDIYKEAETAFMLNLKEVAGPGFRKSFEYLIKDYAISKEDDVNVKEKIKSNPSLASVIRSYIKHDDIKNIAEKTAWLGNDEAHYMRVWIDKDISDLVSLIELTVYWIEMEVRKDKYLKEMTKKIE